MDIRVTQQKENSAWCWKPSQLPKANKIMDHKNEPTTVSFVNQNNCVCVICTYAFTHILTHVLVHAHTDKHTQRRGEGGRDRKEGGRDGYEKREERVLIPYMGNDFSQMILNAVIP